MRRSLPLVALSFLTDADAAWLKGEELASVVRVTFTADGKDYASEELMLVPHTHADGTTHR